MAEIRPAPNTATGRDSAMSLWRRYPSHAWLGVKPIQTKVLREIMGEPDIARPKVATYPTMRGRMYCFETMEHRDEFVKRTGAEIP